MRLCGARIDTEGSDDGGWSAAVAEYVVRRAKVKLIGGGHSAVAGMAPWMAALYSTVPYTERKYEVSTYLVFGSETKGLPDFLWEKCQTDFYKIPMRTNLVRSLNLAQAASIALYEAIRQTGYDLRDTGVVK